MSSIQIQIIDRNRGDWPKKIATSSLAAESGAIRSLLSAVGMPIYFGRSGNAIGAASRTEAGGDCDVLAYAPAIRPEDLGDDAFKRHHNVKYAYHSGAMANGIASVELVIALGKADILSSFGAAGLVPRVLENAVRRIQAALPRGPYAVNLIHAPAEEALERGTVETLLKLGVKTVEASAYLGLTEHIVRYRLAGLSKNADGGVNVGHKVIAKLSRTEVARSFMQPAPQKMVGKLVAECQITPEQAELSRQVPMADDITAEADSGGHTDNRPFVSLLPTIIALRDEIQAQYNYPNPIRVGAGGGIGSPEAALAAFAMGAGYVVVGSIQQSCVEAGTSEHTRKLLSTLDMADVTMAPASDMFEMGVKVQVVKRGSMFAMRAKKLYDLYVAYDSIDDIPEKERAGLETQVFRSRLEDIWETTQAYFRERDAEMLSRAASNPKRKMALIFRWYLGLSSRWSNSGEPGREMDYQIWAGPSIGAFNSWVRGSYLEDYSQRRAVEVAIHLLSGAAYLERINQLRLQRVSLPNEWCRYRPEPL
jgi:trans-AT polyketide synthase, acyltransferase and oxidoreductase domains